MLKKTTYKLAPALVLLFAIEGGLKLPAKGAMEATRAVKDAAVREIESPAGAESIEPNLSVGPDGRAYLSWFEPVQPSGYAMKFAIRSRGGSWSTARTITQTENRYGSSILALPDGLLAAYWLTKSGPGRHANDVNVSISRDGGQTWGKPIIPHRDRTPAVRGFATIIPANGGIAVVWLNGSPMMMESNSGAVKHGSDDVRPDIPRHGSDHRRLEGGNQGGAKHDMTASKMETSLMYTTIDLDGTIAKEVLLDSRVCECCQTAAAPTPDGIVVVYRDRSEKEVRDISILRSKNGKWSEPEPLSKDGWEINGCPVNGPAISSSGKNVAVAWYTGARDQSRVYGVLSTDGGVTFGSKVLVSDGKPIGRVDVVASTSGDALISWAERTEGGTEVRARIVRRDGSTAPTIVVAAASSGVARMQLSGNEVIIAWTDAQDKGKVRTAILSMTGR